MAPAEPTDPPIAHSWALTPKDAIALQNTLRGWIVRTDDLRPVRRIAGVDVAYGSRQGPARAAVVVVDAQSGARLEEAVATLATAFPYVPGLLSFRECPSALAALAKLSQPPDLLLCDGQGIAHPRRLGFASHLGLIAGIPSIGVGKTRLCGAHDEPGAGRGASTPLVDKGEIIGAVLRTRDGVRPVYVSIGHRVSLATAVRLVLATATRYRLPEPIRFADALSKRLGPAEPAPVAAP